MSERVRVWYVALALAGVGALLTLLSLPASSGSCSGVESIDPTGAYRILWVDASALRVHYTPNGGLDRCYVGLGALTLPVGVGAAGIGTTGAGVSLLEAVLDR
jgi:hypothetical protein